MLKQEIAQLIEKVLQEKEIKDVKVIVDYPADPKHGDYSSNVALIAAKKVGKNPKDFATELIEDLRFKIKDLRLIEKVEIAGPGFINFFVAKEALMKAASEDKFSDIGKGKTVVVEYSSPNIAKPFTIGHLRSTIIGDAVANLLQAVGYDVNRDNHLGDWGTQFGKQIYAIKTWGNEEALENSDRPVKLLVDLYVKFHEEAEKNPTLEDEGRAWFKKLEDGDEEARSLWQKCIAWSWKEFDAIYQQLDVSFTENNGKGYGEAYFEDKMASVIDELKEKQLLKEGENGAQLVFFPGDQYPPLMILKKDGSTLYATRDLATDKFRLEKYGKDILAINEVGAEQALYFRQLFKLEEMLGWFAPGQRVHIKHGLYRFKEGKMSTRKGNVIWLEDVLEEAKTRAASLQKAETTAEDLVTQVAIGAIKWNDLKRTPEQDIAFEWDEVLNMQGNSGPYLQYTFARTQSVLRKASGMSLVFPQATEEISADERDLLRLLARFDEVVVEAAGRFSPSTVATYLFELAQAFNLFYQKYPILKGDDTVQHFRLALTSATGNVIKRGLNLLGIQAPERM
jgi:arginyl-tRNA synthetase